MSVITRWSSEVKLLWQKAWDMLNTWRFSRKQRKCALHIFLSNSFQWRLLPSAVRELYRWRHLPPSLSTRVWSPEYTWRIRVVNLPRLSSDIHTYPHTHAQMYHPHSNYINVTNQNKTFHAFMWRKEKETETKGSSPTRSILVKEYYECMYGECLKGGW